ncbi:large ribosomal subunit protein mL65 [Hetaerina americana]|uniref:large ribosomal subunit protein mL65 n=1 Tax=Hetaerina americana TaxID=62018 RepID=UPI003A7F1DB8
MNLSLGRFSLVAHLSKNASFTIGECQRFCSSKSDVSVKYPAILDLSYVAKKYRKKVKWHEKIKALPTVEEKLLEINMPSYYGWKCYGIKEGVIPYDSLHFAQSITRTHMTECEKLPSLSEGLENDNGTSVLADKLTPLLADMLIFECRNRRYSGDEADGLTSSIVRQINWLLMSFLPCNVPHLTEAQVDYEPRIEAFWAAGGMEPSYSTWKSRKNIEWLSSLADDPVDRYIQYEGFPILQVRHPLPLPPVVDLQTSTNPEYEVPHFKYDPRVIGISLQRRHGTNIPGFWPGDPCEFGLMSFHKRNHINNRPKHYGACEHTESLHVQAILASYGWLFPLTCYQGFSTYNDVTYPLVTQTVITDGQFWSFYMYQLNTTIMHSHYSTDNPRRNLCWGTPEMQLYEKIEDGKVVGLNEDVLKRLLKLYLNKPQERATEMKPYLSDYHYVANIPDEKKRQWLETRIKHLYSLRPRHRSLPEIYNWEKIYKIDHETRQMEARRRPFELGVNPYRRRLDEHKSSYIPKKLREDKKKKWEDTYYP